MVAGNTMTTIVSISAKGIESTLDLLRKAGRRNSECVVLWLAERGQKRHVVRQVYLPLQQAAQDFFRIPPEGMEALMQVLDENRLFVAAQVHSHPQTAFHSEADDKWAIVRHKGALSLVVPWFASRATVASFLVDTAVFCLDQHNQWIQVQTSGLEAVLELT
jgi:proteasome lid subunit RPN8/RPN11